MGNVVSIAKARQTDVFSMFDSGCPALPEQTDLQIMQAAAKSADQQKAESPAAFRIACFAICGVSLIGIMLSYLSDTLPGRYPETSSVSSAPMAAAAPNVNQLRRSREQQVQEVSSASAFINNFSSNLVVTEEFTLASTPFVDAAWRTSRETWLAHLATLESDPPISRSCEKSVCSR